MNQKGFICDTHLTEVIMSKTYLSTDQLSERIPYSVRTIRDQLKDSVLLEGIHYIRPFGRRKIFYIWEVIEQDLFNGRGDKFGIPMASQEIGHG
jgi:hypothetical protein